MVEDYHVYRVRSYKRLTYNDKARYMNSYLSCQSYIYAFRTANKKDEHLEVMQTRLRYFLYILYDPRVRHDLIEWSI